MTLSEASWIDLEHCGYACDLPLWTELAALAAGPVVEFGAGTGRVSAHLAAQGFDVTAVEIDADLGRAMRAAAAPSTRLRVLEGDALGPAPRRGAALAVAAMNLLQTIGDARRSRRLLDAAREWVAPDGTLAVHLTPRLPRSPQAITLRTSVPRTIRRHGVEHSLSLAGIESTESGIALEWERVDRGAGERSAVRIRRDLRSVDRSALIDDARAAGWSFDWSVELPASMQSTASEILVFHGR